ncbi:hypothetical protein [Cellulosimicrobium funkei]
MDAHRDVLAAIGAFFDLAGVNRAVQLARDDLRVFAGVGLHLFLHRHGGFFKDALGHSGTGTLGVELAGHGGDVGHQLLKALRIKCHFGSHPLATATSIGR